MLFKQVFNNVSNDDFSTLNSIFQMFQPSDLSGVPTNNNGQNEADNSTKRLIKTLLDRPGGATATVSQMKKELEDLLLKSSDSDLKSFHQSIRFYSTEGNVSSDGFDWHLSYQDVDDPLKFTKIKNNEFERIIGLDPFAKQKSQKKLALICSDENFISPLTIASRDAEVFMNFMPSYVLSRCVPYLNADFVFDRSFLKNSRLNAPSILKFLLGAQNVSTGQAGDFNAGTANDTMIQGNTIKSTNDNSEKEFPIDQTIAGMELFTMPQTLTNPGSQAEGSRYVSVLDHFRPLASIESLTVEVRPTFGMMTYKTANLTLTVHDRSRLHELADLIKPLIYAQTTVWLTYGWRHPVEPGNPYAEFINGKMLIREPYGIVNSSYEFDQVGQVKVNLQLYTRGVQELKDIRITDTKNSFKDLEKQIQRIADDIQKYRQKLKLDKPSGVLKEIRAYQIIEAGSFGEFPNIEPKTVADIVSKIDKTFLKESDKIDAEAVQGLKKSLEELYSINGSKEKKFAFNERFNNRADAAIKKLFDEVRSGPDMFLMTEQKSVEKEKQLGVQKHPFVELIKKYNDTIFRDKQNRSDKQFRRLVSFGKLFSTFMANAIEAISGIDEMQMFFYPLNESAGKAAGVNVSEFPIDMSIFLDQFRDHISRRKTDRITIEEFLKLVIDSQLQDVRGPGYGFFSYYEPYDPKAQPTLKKNQAENYETALAQLTDKNGPFKMPAIDVFVESTYVSRTSSSTNDLLKSFEKGTSELSNNKNDSAFTKVLKIHVFDKTIDPYPLAGQVLKCDDKTGLPKNAKLNAKFQSIIEKSLKNFDQELLLQTGQRLRPDDRFGVQIEDNNTNEIIKRLVSQTIPTIIYGGNASTITNISVQSKQDPLLTSVQMLANKAGRPAVTQPNGGGTFGLPLRVIPGQVSITSLGCPLLRYAQMWFLDMNTGSTIDNRYGITGITHTISPGRFETVMQGTWADAYGSFESSNTLLSYVKSIKIPNE